MAEATGLNAGRANETNGREVTPEVCAAAVCSGGATVPEGGGPSEVVPSMVPGPGGSEQAAGAGGRVGSVLTRFRFPGEKSPTVVFAGLALSSLRTFVTVTDAEPFFERFNTSLEPPARRTWMSVPLKKSPFEK